MFLIRVILDKEMLKEIGMFLLYARKVDIEEVPFFPGTNYGVDQEGNIYLVSPVIGMTCEGYDVLLKVTIEENVRGHVLQVLEVIEQKVSFSERSSVSEKESDSLSFIHKIYQYCSQYLF